MSPAYCVKENKPCVRWVERYFNDCLCNLRDDFSFALGLTNLVCWGVSDIPQLITNFKTKSGHGVSLLLLLTWIAGDVFNLVGCLAEPATLPTQFYAAVLYTISSMVLVFQTIYYDYIYSCWKCRRIETDNTVEDEKKPLKPSKADSGIPILNASPKTNPPREFNCTLSEDEAATVLSRMFGTQPRPIPTAAASYGIFLAVSASLPPGSKAWMEASQGFAKRRVLQEQSRKHSAFGRLLGWLMAVIYMGGRIPQIRLNIKRGSVEGLNPLMFIFALMANATYAASILVRTTEWERIQAILPWLLDAVVCVALDLFIILQYIYYRFLRETVNSDRSEDYGDYMEASKEIEP